MKPNEQFQSRERAFWACVKLVCQQLGYSVHRSKRNPTPGLKRYTSSEVSRAVASLEKASTASYPHIDDIVKYLNLRADLLEKQVQPLLMDRSQAEEEFEKLRKEFAADEIASLLPLNKQKGDKRHHLFLTGIVNMLTFRKFGKAGFLADPRREVVVTQEDKLLYVSARHLDGAFPDYINPKAVWEVKEYYGTTTFGSRVADGVYETLLDGLELAHLREEHNIQVLHYLIVDDRYTWWTCGRSYLCRIVDALHMGLLDEVLFGREVLSRWPGILDSWKPCD